MSHDALFLFRPSSICNAGISPEAPPIQQVKLFPEKEGKRASVAEGKLAHSSATAATQSSAVTDPWTAKCCICSILIFFKDPEAEMLSRWLLIGK